MRVINDRYNRELRSFELARWMLANEARTQTIRAWTGLSGDRVRTLARSHGSYTARALQRHRGPSPNSLYALLSTARARQEAAAAVGLCCLLEVFPEKRIPNARKALPGLLRGERLLTAFEILRGVIPQTRLSLEHLVLLVLDMAGGETWKIDHCTRCHATILIDLLCKHPQRVCEFCEPAEESEVQEPLALSATPATEGEAEEPWQQRRLFD